MNELRAIIRREITACGAISFARFMELSLYCPEFGYYERLTNTPGRHGDFYTSVSVGPLFGELLAFQFARWIEETKLPSAQLLEAGGHDGQLAADILNGLGLVHPRVLEKLEYWILEPSLQRRQRQNQTLSRLAAKVRWFHSWSALPRTGVRGVIFSNELLDALPVHRLGWDAKTKTWFEWGVTVAGDDFVWVRRPLNANRAGAEGGSLLNNPHSALRIPHPGKPVEEPKSEIRNPDSEVLTPRSALRFPRLEDLLAVLPDGFTTEVCPAAAEWWQRAASFLKQGHLLTFDYGRTVEEFFSPERARGSLRAYFRHRLTDNVLAKVGEQDLTAHVNFTAVRAAGESAGLKTEGLFSQAEFLTRIAEAAWKEKSAFGDWTSNRTRQFQTLTHPEHLGRRFKVLIQTR